MGIEKRPLAEQSADEIRVQLLSGQRTAGQRLTEQELSAELSVSRGTIRSALQILADDGLIRLEPYSGWHVLSFDQHDIWEIATLRGALEGLAAELAADICKAESSNHAPLITALAELEDACNRRNKAAISIADVALHQTIVDIGGNSRLAKNYRRIQHQTRFLVESANAAMEIEDVAADHSEIVKAIIGGQSKTARSLAEGHGRRAGQKLAERARKIDEENPNQQNKAN